jgi:WD40 repeat protein
LSYWPHSTVFSPDGHGVLTASADGTARLWEADSGKRNRILIINVPWILEKELPAKVADRKELRDLFRA